MLTMPLAASAASHPSTVIAAPLTAASPIVPSNFDISTIIMPFTPDAFANGFSTLVGALIGAMFAYVLQRHYQKDVELRNARMAAHRLMFALLQQINTIVLIQRDYVFKEIDNAGRFLTIPPTAPFQTDKDILQLSELAFLLDQKNGRSILYEFYIAQENYVSALQQWNLRSTLHLEKVQPALAASGITNGATISDETLQKVLGVYVFGSIVNSTDNCVETLKRSFQKLTAVKGKAREYLVHRFRSDDFTDFDFPETYGLAEAKEAARGSADRSSELPSTATNIGP